MDFLDTIGLPQSTEHFHLLLFIFNLLGLIVIPYLALVSGATLLAWYHDRSGRKLANDFSFRLREDLLTSALPNVSVYVFLAILPTVALVFIYAQLLQGRHASAPGGMSMAALFLVAAGIALFAFRFASRMKVVDISYRGSLTPEGAGERQIHSLERTRVRSAGYALFFILSGAFLSMASFGDALVSGTSTNEASSFFLSGLGWVKFLYFLFLGLGMAGVAVLFFAFSWEGGIEDPEGAYGRFLRSFAVKITTVSLLAQPLLLLGETLLIPRSALSGALFVLIGGTLAFLLVALHFLYAVSQRFRSGYITYALFALLGAAALNVTKDQVALHYATMNHAALLAHEYERESAALSASLGVGAPQLSGEDIYNGKCSACHLFDAKKVGPPYKEVIVKYAGKKNQLISFILNPVKVNPAYPPMPSQGLKPSEADSIATFLLKKVGAPGS